MTTLDDLIETLEGIRDAGVDGDTEMRILIQPNYPLQFTLGNIGVLPSERKVAAAREELNKWAAQTNQHVSDLDDTSGEQVPFADEVKVIYLTTGGHPDDNPYGPSFGRMMDVGEIEQDPDLDRDSEEEPDDEPRHAREDRRYEMKFGASPED